MKSASKTMVAALILISGIALAQEAHANSAAGPTPDKTANTASVSQGGPDYIIGPEDVLHVAVWKEADLTTTLPVRPDGKISLPLLNDVLAAGLTPKQLGEEMCIRDSFCSVIPKSFAEMRQPCFRTCCKNFSP